MANNYAITPGSGDSVTGVDLTTFTAYPTTGKVPAGVVYVSANAAVAPAPVSNANPLPVSDAGGSLTVDGTVAITGAVAVTGTFYQATQPVSGTVAVSNFPATQPVSGTFWQATQPVSGTFWQATQPVSGTVTSNAGTGTFAVSAASLPLPSGAATSALQGTGNTSLASIDTKTPSLGQALAAASVPVVLPAATVTTLTPPAAIAGFALDATLTGGSQKTQLVPATSGGLTMARYLDLGVTGQVAKASAGQLYGYYFFNAAAAVRYIKVYDKATAPTQADTPVMTLGLPAGAGGNVSFPQGIAFAAGVAFRATTAVADSDTGAPTANDVVFNALYK